ncbi:hypothetical protein QVD17_35103 [Tagetes erecta]|uniref:Transmembrane protein n=1 Tax=Tagetes erecta TaxID=13708 RepID=A0AAD8K1H6_TARER|nr:hypothetical protein QVD17_35103 [Tagetes erecta]
MATKASHSFSSIPKDFANWMFSVMMEFIVDGGWVVDIYMGDVGKIEFKGGGCGASGYKGGNVRLFSRGGSGGGAGKWDAVLKLMGWRYILYGVGWLTLCLFLHGIGIGDMGLSIKGGEVAVSDGGLMM